MKELNLTPELARLLTFTANVAIAIRMYSAYSGANRDNPHAPNDIMFLSDCLHNFDRLGNSIQQSPESIISACDMLLGIYAGYQVEDVQFGSRQPKHSFDRNKVIFSLSEGIGIFTDIRAKVLPFVKSAQ